MFVARKSAVLIPVIIAAVAIGILGIVFAPSEITSKSASLPKGTVKVNDNVVTVEVASTAAERERWLTFRQDALPLNTAMLLKFAGLLSTHIRKEERQLFERMQGLLTQEEMVAIGEGLQGALANANESCLLPNEATRLRGKAE